MWSLPQQTGDIRPALVYCWANVVDGDPTVNQRWNSVSCLLLGQLTTFEYRVCYAPMILQPLVLLYARQYVNQDDFLFAENRKYVLD